MIIDLGTATGTQSIWKQERVIVYVDNMLETLKMWTDLEGSSTSPLATYSADADGYYYIDITDYVRTNPSVTSFVFDDDNTQVTLAVSVVGLINPENVIIPDSAMLQRIGGTGIMCPPAMMIVPVNSLTIITECYGYESGTVNYGNEDGTVGYSNLSANALTIPNEADRAYYNSAYMQYLQPMRCGVRYAAVRWVSFTGQTRQHTFEVEKCKTATGSDYSLLPIDNEYVNIKGRVDSFNLHLGGLCAYDLWYYADVLHSSKVEVSFDGSTFDRVQVTSKDITIPDGEAGTKGELDINVNWKRYDAVAM